MKPATDPTSAEIVAWLDAFAASVRSADYEAGRRLFAPDVVGFGTIGVMLRGLDSLVADQWKRVWGVTRGFHFHMQHLVCGSSGDVAWAAVPWTSEGCRADGSSFDRHGRATYILERRDQKWIAIHTHHSLDPASAPSGQPRVIT